MSPSKKKVYLGTNTKMFQTALEAEQFISRLKSLTEDIDRNAVELFVLPSFTSLHRAVPAAGSRIRIGAQTMGWTDRGAFTGEISPLMLEELGVHFVMVGHSERRHTLHETSEEEALRVNCAVRHKFHTLLCIGETAQQKAAGRPQAALDKQLRQSTAGLTPEQAAEYLWVAYEPVWAIGEGGVPADECYANEMHASIREILTSLFGARCASRIPILYGGSVNPDNAVKLAEKEQIDGLYIGRSAWDADRFHSIIRSVLPIFQARGRNV